jgi:hypothetical protein
MAIKAAMLLPALTCWSAMALAIEEDPNANLTPTGAVDGPVLEVDFPGLQIGVAEYEEGPTGATLFLFDSKVKGAVDVRGGSPGTVLTDLLRQGSETTGATGAVSGRLPVCSGHDRNSGTARRGAGAHRA